MTITNTVTLSGPRLTMGELREFCEQAKAAKDSTIVRVTSYDSQRDGSSVTLVVSLA